MSQFQFGGNTIAGTVKMAVDGDNGPAREQIRLCQELGRQFEDEKRNASRYADRAERLEQRLVDLRNSAEFNEEVAFLTAVGGAISTVRGIIRVYRVFARATPATFIASGLPKLH